MARGATKEEATAHEEWRAVLESVGQSAGTAQIFRKAKGKEWWLETVGVSAVSADPHQFLKDHYGGGEYKVQLKDEGGRYIKKSTVHFSLEGPPRAPEDAKGNAPTAASSEPAGQTAILIEMMRQQGESQRAAAAAAASGPDPVALATAMMSAITAATAPLLAAILERKDPPPATSALDTVETLTAILALAQKMGGNDDGFSSLVKTLGDPVAKLVDAHLSGPAGAAARPNLAPVADEPARPAWYGLLRPVLPQLVAWAGAGRDATLRADLILEEVPDHQLGLVYEQLTREGFTEEFFAHVPEAQAHRDWFGLFFDSLLSGIRPVEEPGADGEPAPQLAPVVEEGAPA